MVKQITQFMNGINLDEVATGGTHFHDQKETNFCHSFAAVSGMRNGLKKATENKESKEIRGRISVEVRGNKTAQEVLVDSTDSDDKDFKNVCSFQKMLAGFINNVNPRSLDGLDGDRFRKLKMANQAAYLDKVINRLTSKTMFETNGWKRIYGVIKFFEAFELDPEDYELEAMKVTHPIAVGNRTFQQEIMVEKEAGNLETSMTEVKCGSHRRTFTVNSK